MIVALRLVGEGTRWRAEVVATALTGDAAWIPVERPASVSGRRPDLVVLRAITAHRATLRPWVRHSCGFRWRARPGARYCPGCKNPLPKSKRERAAREAERLLELATGSAGLAVKEA